MKHEYTDEQRKFIRENVNGNDTYKLTDMINAEFDVSLKRSQIRAYLKNHKLKTGIDARFKKG